jgi:hypothetical protein
MDHQPAPKEPGIIISACLLRMPVRAAPDSVEQSPLIFEQPFLDLGHIRHGIGKRQYPEPLGVVFDPRRTVNLRVGKLPHFVRTRERAQGARHGVTQLWLFLPRNGYAFHLNVR